MPEASASLAAMLAFVDAFEPARPVLAEHVAACDDVLPHVLMADFAPPFCRPRPERRRRTGAQFVSAIEGVASSGDADVRNVIEVSFVEGLFVAPDEHGKAAIRELVAMMGPATARSVANFERFAGGS